MNHMIRLAAVVLSTMIVATGCAPKALNLDQEAAANAILEQIDFQDELLLADAPVIGNYYQGMDGVSDNYTVYISGTSVTCEEIAIVTAAEGKTADDVKAVLQKRVEDQKTRYENYMPQEMVKLNTAVIEAKSDTVIMIISDNSDAASQLIRDLLAGK